MSHKVVGTIAALILAVSLSLGGSGASAAEPSSESGTLKTSGAEISLPVPQPLPPAGADTAADDGRAVDNEPLPPDPMLPMPLSDEDPVTADDGGGDREPLPPDPASSDEDPVAADDPGADREPLLPDPASPDAAAPAKPTEEAAAAGAGDGAEHDPGSPILTLPLPLFDEGSVTTDNDTADQEPPSPILAMPKLLSDSDEALYRRIFDLQEDGLWRKADKLIAKLDNKILMGHVLGQRYLHPTRYRSHFKELAAWLRKYADLPDAKRIHALAMKRKPGRARPPRKPRTREPIYHGESGNGGYEPILLNGHRYSRRTARIQRYIRRLVRRERLTIAEKYLAKNLNRLPAPHADIARARIAAGWFFLGNDRKTFELADDAAWRSGRYAPFAHWYAGLAAYRMGHPAVAAPHFERMAEMEGLSGWYRAGAAFWAARANMVAKKPDRVSYWLARAAEFPRTFYGMIGRRLLGAESPFRWNDPILKDDTDIAIAFSDIRAKRALALIQVEQYYRAETELRQLAKSASIQTKLALVAIADQVGLPALALRAASSLQDVSGRRIERGLYPLPHWTPKNGFIVDRALIFAIMRQESAFNSRARSGAGARGLMQLMPATASYMAKRRFRGRSRNKLYDPALNMMLGQKYLRYLIQREGVDGNLFMMAVAYNGGPGNLAKWKRRSLPYSKDPLMFIESIPARETRDFVERVLSNLWMYRERLGQQAPSLDAIAAGRLPLYKALDASQIAEADPNDGRN